MNTNAPTLAPTHHSEPTRVPMRKLTEAGSAAEPIVINDEPAKQPALRQTHAQLLESQSPPLDSPELNANPQGSHSKKRVSCIFEFSSQLETHLRDGITQTLTDDTDLIQLGNTLTFIRHIIAELKAFLADYIFERPTDEIRFFKEVKPIFLTQYFYYKKLASLHLFDSFKDPKARQANYYKVLEQLEKYTRKHHEFYEYCMTGNTTLDVHYFTRHPSLVNDLDRDEQFTTGYDTKLSKIFANELLKKYILDALADTQAGPEGTAGTLTWTSSKTDLIELIYALHFAGVLNNGSSDIKQLADVFQHLFNVHLGDYYRTFLNIRIRKSGQTNFLDSMKESFLQKLGESD